MTTTQRSFDTLRGEHVLLVRITTDDIDPLLATWERDPSIRERWTSFPRSDLEDMVAGRDETVGFCIRADDGELVGFVQHYQERDPDYRHAGIDIFLATAAQGHGLGTDAVRTVATHLVRDLGHHRLVIDPAADNEAAIRCYEKVGFRRVGLMREYERGPDGSFHDGLLMDLLARELA